MVPVIFFDMDGVLADFYHGSLRAHGKVLPFPEARWDFMTQVGFAGGSDPAFWGPISNPDFWANLPVLEYGRELFERIDHAVPPESLAVLSSGLCPGSSDGKREWLKKHFPTLEPSAFFGTQKSKAASPCKILVDDHGPNVDGFTKANGWGILAPAPWNEARNRTRPDGSYCPRELSKYVIDVWQCLSRAYDGHGERAVILSKLMEKRSD